MTERVRELERRAAVDPTDHRALEVLHRERTRRGEQLPDVRRPDPWFWLRTFLALPEPWRRRTAAIRLARASELGLLTPVTLGPGVAMPPIGDLATTERLVDILARAWGLYLPFLPGSSRSMVIRLGEP